jgi:hypothetical protein
LLDGDGRCHILSEGASKQHLGSGALQPFTFRLTMNARDTLLLLSDGAWTPLTLYLLQKACDGSRTTALLRSTPVHPRRCWPNGQGRRHDRRRSPFGAVRGSSYLPRCCTVGDRRGRQKGSAERRDKPAHGRG